MIDDLWELTTMSGIRTNGVLEDNAPLTPVYAAPIDHPGAWKVADFKSPADYTMELEASHLRDIEHAVRRIKAAGLGLDDLQREHFEVPSLWPVIDEIRHQIEDGRGGRHRTASTPQSRPGYARSNATSRGYGRPGRGRAAGGK